VASNPRENAQDAVRIANGTDFGLVPASDSRPEAAEALAGSVKQVQSSQAAW
jgi:hypothetical protein